MFGSGCKVNQIVVESRSNSATVKQNVCSKQSAYRLSVFVTDTR